MTKQSSEKKQKRPKTVLTIVEGGECTFIIPFSYYDYDSGFEYENKILLLETIESGVDQEWKGTDFLKWEVPGIVFATMKRFWRTLQRCDFWRLLNFKREWDNIRLVVGASIYRDSTICVDGCLTPSIAGSRWTDTSFLIPSEEWASNKLTEWLFLPRPSNSNMHTTEIVKDNYGGPDIVRKIYFQDKIRQSYLTWAKAQVSCGRKIGFFTSLDT